MDIKLGNTKVGNFVDTKLSLFLCCALNVCCDWKGLFKVSEMVKSTLAFHLCIIYIRTRQLHSHNCWAVFMDCEDLICCRDRDNRELEDNCHSMECCSLSSGSGSYISNNNTWMPRMWRSRLELLSESSLKAFIIYLGSYSVENQIKHIVITNRLVFLTSS